MKFATKPLPPTQLATRCSGIKALTKPVTNTPPNNKGMIDLAKPQVWPSQSLISSRSNQPHTMNKVAARKANEKYQRFT